MSRVAAGVFGAYALSWSFAAFLTAAAHAAGMSYTDASALSVLLALLSMLAGFCWSFAAASVLRVWSVFVGGALAMTLAAGWLSRAWLT